MKAGLLQKDYTYLKKQMIIHSVNNIQEVFNIVFENKMRKLKMLLNNVDSY